MKQIRLYLDEDAMRHSLVKGLRAKGIEVLTPLEAGMEGREDWEQLEFTSEKEHTLFTFNVKDFCQLHTEWLRQERIHSGIIVMPYRSCPVGEQIRRLVDLIGKKSAEEMQNQIEFL